ncbi:MAG: hypothetical protein ACE3L7_07285 [Candidatus Pristimantibacillus sp.]
MTSPISPKAMQMIYDALGQVMLLNKSVSNLKLYVCPTSPIARFESIDTKYGALQVLPGEYVPKGVSYIIENSTGRRGRAFAWVSRSEGQSVNK